MSTPRAHSRELLPMLAGLLEKSGTTWQNIGAFAVGVGPGSFTGLRVACATIAGINASLKKPVYSLCSLGITARQTDSDLEHWAIEDARSGLVYAAKYQADHVIEAAQCLSWDSFLNCSPKIFSSTSDIPVAHESWQRLPLVFSREQALLAAVKAIHPESDYDVWVEPVYLQPSQAEKDML